MDDRQVVGWVTEECGGDALLSITTLWYLELVDNGPEKDTEILRYRFLLSHGEDS